MRVGNFSVMNRDCLESLCTCSELWNHYAASAFATRQPMSFVPTNRATRLAGESKMNFPALVMHGLSALSVFSDRIGTRLLILSGTAASMTIAGMVAVVIQERYSVQGGGCQRSIFLSKSDAQLLHSSTSIQFLVF